MDSILYWNEVAIERPRYAYRDGRFRCVQVGGAGGVDGYRVDRDGTLVQIAGAGVSGLDGLEGIAAT